MVPGYFRLALEVLQLPICRFTAADAPLGDRVSVVVRQRHVLPDKAHEPS